MQKHALITGITGQDGSYLAEFLLKKGYKVYGTVRRLSTPNMENIRHLQDDVELLSADLLDQTSLSEAIVQSKPDEVYNLAAQSFVKASFDQPVLTGEFTALGVTRVLEAIRNVNPKIKFYQASSSEMFGKVVETPQKETTRFHPRSPYGVACNGILFNHESPRRGIEFVTRKISHAVARIKLGTQKKLVLGNLDAKRDWGYAGDYVEAMWLILQQDKPEDYVVATGETHSVREFVKLAFAQAGIEDWQKYVIADDPKHLRPAEVDYLIGDFNKAKKDLAWEPKTSFKALVAMMVDSDLKREKKQ